MTPVKLTITVIIVRLVQLGCHGYLLANILLCSLVVMVTYQLISCYAGWLSWLPIS